MIDLAKGHSHKTHNSQPKLFVVMGVSGCGKTTLGQHVAKTLSYEFVEADDFHSAQAKERMANNLPLDDEMRAPWITAIINRLNVLHAENKSVVLAYSGLKLKHRNRFRTLNFNSHFIYLTTDESTIVSRVKQRESHFFSAELVTSQFTALEEPKDSEADITFIKTSAPLAIIKQSIVQCVQQYLAKELS